MSVPPSENEEQHFKGHELRLRVQRPEQQQLALVEAEKLRPKELRYLHCPKCSGDLC